MRMKRGGWSALLCMPALMSLATDAALSKELPVRATGAAAVAKPKKLKLALNLKKGQVIKQELNFEETLTHSMPENKKLVYTSGMRLELRHTVLAATPKGDYRIQTTYKAVQYSVQNDQNSVVYDSTQVQIVDPVVAAAAARAGQSITYTLTGEGQILNVTGIDKIVNRYLQLANVTEKEKAAVSEKAKAEFQHDLLFDTDKPTFPNRAIGVGDYWRENESSKAEGTSLKHLFTVTGRNRDKMEVTLASSLYSGNANRTGVTIEGIRFQAAFNARQSGLLTFNEKTGWLHSAELSQDMVGIATASLQGVTVQWPVSGHRSIQLLPLN